jgi:hypothetical protein
VAEIFQKDAKITPLFTSTEAGVSVLRHQKGHKSLKATPNNV